MIINEKQFKKVLVQTQSGQVLGRLSSFELETDNGMIEKYYIKSKISLAGLLGKQLIINKEQVISFDENKMIVEDMAVKEKSETESILKKIEGIESAEPIISERIN